jgi:hypothetical protein
MPLRPVFTISLLLILSLSSHGQWYVKRYNVNNINLLSREQLNESLKESRTELLYSGIISAGGVGVFFAGRYLPYEITDESSVIEQLFGEKGMKKVLMVTGAGIAAGGAIAAVVCLGRIGRIKSVINEYYSLTGPFEVKPAVIVNSDMHTYCPGITLTCYF